MMEAVLVSLLIGTAPGVILSLGTLSEGYEELSWVECAVIGLLIISWVAGLVIYLTRT